MWNRVGSWVIGRARKCISEKGGEWGDRVGKKGDGVGVGVRLKGR